ncbi:periplasmic divalent cation tolerance protein CutA [Encephalitozoon cuniculi]|nr:periplasmic divalent cation tolerance protein CutA [Encephalitozoon cuniculi]
MKRPFAVSVTYPTRESAEESSCELVRRKLAACCQISEITSIYFWKEAIV